MLPLHDISFGGEQTLHNAREIERAVELSSLGFKGISSHVDRLRAQVESKDDGTRLHQ
jgi:hypothetical protein